MIRNIVFDMGNVLLKYHPMTACLRHAQNEADAKAVFEALFMAKEWEEKLDGCFITEAEMLEIAQSRLESPEQKTLCAEIFEDFHTDALTPVEGMEEVLSRLKDRGFGLYLLSNVGERIYQFRRKIPCHDRFDGFLFSGEEHLLKPDPAIFERFCERFGVAAAECLFVDDRSQNIEAAVSVGMEGYLFEAFPVEALKKFVEALPSPA